MTPSQLPRHSDTVVIGGGTAGAAVACLLAERGDQSVLLLEAGPDYGPFAEQRWPAELPRWPCRSRHPRLVIHQRCCRRATRSLTPTRQGDRRLLGSQRLHRTLGQPRRLRRLGRRRQHRMVDRRLASPLPTGGSTLACTGIRAGRDNSVPRSLSQRNCRQRGSPIPLT